MEEKKKNKYIKRQYKSRQPLFKNEQISDAVIQLQENEGQETPSQN